MLMIVANHFSAHGGWNFTAESNILNSDFIQMLRIGGKLGVNIFIMISGYFLIQSNGGTARRLLKLWGQLVFYGVGIYIFYIVITNTPFDVHNLLQVLFPITNVSWWFANDYFILVMFVPFINVMLKNIDRKQYKNMLITLFFLWGVLGMVFDYKAYGMNTLLWFVFVYSVAAYIRLYDVEFGSMKKCVVVVLGLFLLNFAYVAFANYMGQTSDFWAEHVRFFYCINSWVQLILAVYIFAVFRNCNIKYTKLINMIASGTFGVYLLHDNKMMRSVIWSDIFNVTRFQESGKLILYCGIVVALIFAVGVILDLIRIHTVERFYMKVVNVLLHRFEGEHERNITR